MDLTIANQGGGGSVSALRDYRKGNWNLQETMILIEAKRMDDERRMKRLGETAERGKPAELRWKWVEDYCWKNGCFRSQNQCNDKWDNLMRDFKKVREFERRAAEGGAGEDKSYWKMEKTERKDRNLPSNMLRQIYDALVAVVERKGPTPPLPPGLGGAGTSIGNMPAGVVEKSTHSMPSPLQQCPINLHAPAILLPLPPPPPPPPQTTAEPPTSLPSAQPLPTIPTLLSTRVHQPREEREETAETEAEAEAETEKERAAWRPPPHYKK